MDKNKRKFLTTVFLTRVIVRRLLVGCREFKYVIFFSHNIFYYSYNYERDLTTYNFFDVYTSCGLM